MPVTLYHNPRCQKSRETLVLIEKRGIKPRIVDYLKHPPTVAELKVLRRQLGFSARELLRHKEAGYKPAGLDHPAPGRPPENILQIL